METLQCGACGQEIAKVKAGILGRVLAASRCWRCSRPAYSRVPGVA